jgi:hypothetical protein
MTPPHPVAADTASRPESVATQHAYLALARRLLRAPVSVLGLWPVCAETELADAPIRLAKTMSSLGYRVGLLTPERWSHTQAADEPLITELSEGVVDIRPSTPTSNLSATLEKILPKIRGSYDRIVLDLSGLDVVAMKEVSLVPEVGIAFFVLPGRITEYALARLQRQLPSERLLGVAFVEQTRVQDGV